MAAGKLVERTKELIRLGLYRSFRRKDYRYLNRLKGREEGLAGFVIGNGPSLRISDLDRLNQKGQVVSIASNKIYLAYDETSWRPDYYTIADPLVWEKCKSELGAYHEQVFAPSYIWDAWTSRNAVIYPQLGAVSANQQTEGHSSFFSPDVSQAVYSGGSVTYENLQLAVHLGLNPIFIIGCDHTYGGSGERPEENTSRKIQHEDGVQNHFVRDYRKPGEVVYSANLIQMNAAFQEARDFSDRNGIRIYNATRGGELEVFERSDLDEVLADLN